MLVLPFGHFNCKQMLPDEYKAIKAWFTVKLPLSIAHYVT